MELQDLQRQWVEYDKRLDTSVRLNARLVREASFDRASSSLKPLTRAILFELLLNVPAVLLLGSFLGDHVRELRFAAPALMLDVCAILLIVSGVHQLVALDIDYGAPIVEIQKKLEWLKTLRIRATKWTLLLSPLLWTPLLIVALKGLFGVDAYAVFDKGFLAANLLFGVVATGLMVWVSRRFADRFQGSPWVQRLMDVLAGRSLSKATAFLDTLARFERDGNPA